MIIQKIVKEPIDDVLAKIDQSSNSSILLTGVPGAGKTTIINTLLEREIDKEKPIIDGSIKMGEYIFLKYNNINNLYHMCLIIQKILFYIKKNYEKEYKEHFIFFNYYIENILKNIIYMHITDMYKLNNISEDLLNSPDLLLNDLLSIMVKVFNFNQVTLVIDNFDTIGGSSERYQKFIYETLKKYLNVLITISSENALNNLDLMESLGKKSEIINVDYNLDVQMVKNILDSESINCLKDFDILSLDLRASLILSDDVIKNIIIKTKGNLFDMLFAIRTLYRHIHELPNSEYGTFILKFIDQEINKNPVISGRIIPKRTLYIK